MPGQRFPSILRATRLESTGRGQHRPQQELVATNQPARKSRANTHEPALRCARSSAWRMSDCKSAIDACSARARATKTASTPIARDGPSVR